MLYTLINIIAPYLHNYVDSIGIKKKTSIEYEILIFDTILLIINRLNKKLKLAITNYLKNVTNIYDISIRGGFDANPLSI